MDAADAVGLTAVVGEAREDVLEPAERRHRARAVTAVTAPVESRAEPAPEGPGERLMTRKLQLVGGTTYAVTLPKSWVRSLGLEAGDEVTLTLRPDGTVWVVPRSHAEAPARTRVLHMNGQEPSDMLPLLTAAYLAGHEPLVLRWKGPVAPPMLRAVREACARLRGLQIVEEGVSQVTLLDLTDSKELSLPRVLRMMHLHASQLLRHAESAFARPLDPGQSAEIERSEGELDHLAVLVAKRYNYLLRHLDFHPRSETTVEDGLAYLNSAQYLERVGDYACRIAEALGRMEPSQREGLAAAGVPAQLRQAAKLLDQSIKALERADVHAAGLAIREAVAFVDAAHPLADASRAGPSAAFAIVESVQRVAMYAKSIAEVGIDRAVASATAGGAGPAAPR